MIDELTCAAFAVVAVFLGGTLGALWVGYLWHLEQRDQIPPTK